MKLLLQRVLFVLLVLGHASALFAAGPCVNEMASFHEPILETFPILKSLELLKNAQWVSGFSHPDDPSGVRYKASLFHSERMSVSVELDSKALEHRLSGMSVIIEVVDSALSFKRQLDEYGATRVHSRHTVQPTEKLNWILRYENIESQSGETNLPLEEFLTFAMNLALGRSI